MGRPGLSALCREVCCRGRRTDESRHPPHVPGAGGRIRPSTLTHSQARQSDTQDRPSHNHYQRGQGTGPRPPPTRCAHEDSAACVWSDPPMTTPQQEPTYHVGLIYTKNTFCCKKKNKKLHFKTPNCMSISSCTSFTVGTPAHQKVFSVRKTVLAIPYISFAQA